MEPTLDGMAAPLDFTPWTSKVKTFSKSTAVAMQMHAMFDDDLSMETAIVALQAKLSAACKEVLWKDVLLQKLETTLKHADERADANQVELEHALLEHAKQTMLVASLDTKLRECEDAHAATRLSLADMQIQRTDLVDRCAALARDMSVAQQMRDQSDRGCREWKERCAQLESERRQHMQALHAQQHEAFQLQIKHENLQRSLQRLEDEHQILLQQRRTCFPRHAPTNPPAARCDQGSQCTMPDVSTRHAQTVMCAILDDDNVAVEAKRAAIARQQDLMTIASQAKQLQVLQAALDHWQATCRRTVQAYEELRSKANMWKGCVATLLPIYQEQVNSLELAKSAKAEWTKAKQSLEADGRRVAMQLEQVQGMLRQANDQLAIDHQLLVDSKKRYAESQACLFANSEAESELDDAGAMLHPFSTR
ncbi:hypothetical protein DYB32_000148 [Aphanomyces invadans]|uniref:Uncharacterized protein n=1 Tax=Aphanomyces invadans TaxID=157072 RepID=A0A418BAY8_9STRA|nr:hypothetical protein DYB32_000148 [Aphanomyces invadans]